jgi:hypothetical protein
MGFGLFSPLDWALICLVRGPSYLGLISGDVTPYSLCTFDTFLVLS